MKVACTPAQFGEKTQTQKVSLREAFDTSPGYQEPDAVKDLFDYLKISIPSWLHTLSLNPTLMSLVPANTLAPRLGLVLKCEERDVASWNIEHPNPRGSHSLIFACLSLRPQPWIPSWAAVSAHPSCPHPLPSPCSLSSLGSPPAPPQAHIPVRLLYPAVWSFPPVVFPFHARTLIFTRQTPR